MLFKIDENLPRELTTLLAGHGHSADTIVDEGLGGQPDRSVIDACRAEGRALITLDVGLGNIQQYPPAQYPGIIVLRLRNQSREAVPAIVTGLIPLLEREPLSARLWIVDESSVRIRSRADTP